MVDLIGILENKTKMFSLLVFSKDRAAQLDLLLNSIARNTHSIGTVSVLWKASTPEFETAYKILQEERPDVIWIKEFDFKRNVYYMLEWASEYFAFATDDDILYREFNVDGDELEHLFNSHNIACLSMRLGWNCTVQYNYSGEKSVFPRSVIRSGQFYIWDHRYVGRGNFAYKWSVDGHIMSKTSFIPVLNTIEFVGPNEMEGKLSMKMSMGPPNMSGVEHSVIVNTPTNRVQNAAANRAGEVYGKTADELNKLFLQGKRIVYDKIDFSGICGCHQELLLTLE